MSDSILIRADASPAIGAGHVMRCLALAQQWQLAGGKAIFAQAETTPGLAQRLRNEGFETISLPAARGSTDDATKTINLAQTYGASWVIADGYCFGTDWQKRIHNSDIQLLIVDDYGQAENYHSDTILNQNLCADASLYAHREPDTQLLLGSQYALLRREFLEYPRTERTIPKSAQKVLVTLGGGDPDNVTARVINALQQIQNIEAVVVVGGLNPHIASLTASIKSLPVSCPKIELAVSATNMPELMAWADVAIAAGGSTSWELAFMGLPAAVIILADNQTEVAAALERQGISINLGRHENLLPTQIAAALQSLILSQPSRLSMSQKGTELIDGAGASRVIAKLNLKAKQNFKTSTAQTFR